VTDRKRNRRSPERLVIPIRRGKDAFSEACSKKEGIGDQQRTRVDSQERAAGNRRPAADYGRKRKQRESARNRPRKLRTWRLLKKGSTEATARIAEPENVKSREELESVPQKKTTIHQKRDESQRGGETGHGEEVEKPLIEETRIRQPLQAKITTLREFGAKRKRATQKTRAVVP